MNEYDEIYEELCERVVCGELTLEEAEIINDVAYDKYTTEKTNPSNKKGYNNLNARLSQIKTSYKKARTPQDYKEVAYLCDIATDQINNCIKNVREYDETNKDELIYLMKKIVLPSLLLTASYESLLYLKTKEKPKYNNIEDTFRTAAATSLFKDSMNNLMHRGINGKDGKDARIFMSAKQRTITSLRTLKLRVAFIKKRCNSKIK